MRRPSELRNSGPGERRFHRAALRLANNYTIAPAIISQTVLDMFNAVLDPDDRINGAVQLNMPSVVLPIDGIALDIPPTFGAASPTVRETDNQDLVYPASRIAAGTAVGNRTFIKTKADGSPDITATLNGLVAGNISLVLVPSNSPYLFDLQSIMNQAKSNPTISSTNSTPQPQPTSTP